MLCPFDIYNNGQAGLQENRRTIQKDGHEGVLYELNSADGISFNYCNLISREKGKVIIENRHPFIQLSYTLSGRKIYSVDEGARQLASFNKREYNFLFLNRQEIHLSWLPGERLETFELGISPELFLSYLPEDHPFFMAYHNSHQQNTAMSMSAFNLPLSQPFIDVLYQILRCPLEGRYKQLYIKSKAIELLAFQLEQYVQLAGAGGMAVLQNNLKRSHRERMYQAREIILSNIHNPASLIDLAHQVGTNEAYLKKHFKQLFGHTVFGYLQEIKMSQAKELLLQGQSVSEVADRMGYKYAVHFARAFKKYFGYSPNKLKR